MPALHSLLLWLDAVPARYWAVVDVAIGLVALSAAVAYFAPQFSRRWNPAWLFALLVLAAAFAFRWPLIFDNQQLNNPDESQMIAGAIVLKSAPVFWLSVDGTTHGPFVQWPLAIAGALGMRLDYTNARIFATLLIWSSVAFTFLTLRGRLSDGLSRVLVLPMALFFCTNQYWDFVQYSSEHVPIALLSAALWLILDATLPVRPGAGWRLAIAGVLLGAVPFAKLQATPIGLWIGGAGILFLFTETARPWRERLRLAAFLTNGALLVPACMAIMITSHHLWSDFWVSYFEANLSYARADPINWLHASARFHEMAGIAEQFREYFYPVCAIGVVGAIIHGFLPRRSGLTLLFFFAGLLLVSLYAILTPNRPFLHYLQFAIAPAMLLAGFTVGELANRIARARDGLLMRCLSLLLIGVFLGFATSPTFRFFRAISQPHAGQFTATRGQLHRSEPAHFVHAITRPDDSVAIWGWEPNLFVEAGRRHASREAHSALELFDGNYREYYRQRYLADLRRQDPAVFVDATGPGTFFFTDRSRYAHETFPPLAQHIAARYRFLCEMGHARVYLRRDRPFDPPPH